MHLALVALPIRALFIPIGFQSIRCDPNVLFEAIEQVKKEKEEELFPDLTAQEEKKPEFFYFSDKAQEKKAHDEMNTEDQLRASEMIAEVRPTMSPEEIEREEASMRQQLKATIGQGEENLANEMLGISDIGLEAQEYEEDKISILPVSFDLNFRSIVTKGLCFRSHS